MKKLLAFILVLIMALSCMNITAIAGSGDEYDSITLDKTAITLLAGYSFMLTETVHDTNLGNVTANVTWSSSDETVATVSEDGTIKAVKSGTAIISAIPDGYEENNTNGKTPLKATCSVTVVDAILDTDTNNTKDIEQKYDVTINQSYTDVNKVQVSWKIPNITTTVTIDKKWNTETFSWDTTNTADNSTGATAEFNFVNLSSKKVVASVSFKAETTFANTSGKTDKYSESYKVNDAASEKAKTIIDSIVADQNNLETLAASAPSAKIEVTLTPEAGIFNGLTESASDQKFGTYTVKIGKAYAISSAIDGITLDKNAIEEGETNVEITLTATGVDMPKKVKIGDTEYTVTNNKITLASITSDIVISEVTGPTDNYLAFTANEADSTIKFNPKSGEWQYSTDKINWTEGDSNTVITLDNEGDTVYLKGSNCNTDAPSYRFTMTGSISASGSVTSLLDGKGIDSKISLTEKCFSGMFYNCSSLTTAPELPATTLAKKCYYCMFYKCSNLQETPLLPATTLAVECYREMFKGCTSLVKAPALPVKTLANYCYYGMFQDCTSLTTAPELPATTLLDSCYQKMFYNCKSLTTVPELPTATLDIYCYSSMFYNCESLKVQEDGNVPAEGGKIVSFPNTISVTNPFNEMFKGTAGTFTGTPSAGKTYYWYK